MNSFSSLTSKNNNQDNSEVLVNVIVKQEADGRTVAIAILNDLQTPLPCPPCSDLKQDCYIVPGWSELQVEASDRTTALAQVKQRLETHLAGAEIVSLSVKLPSNEQKNPWLAMAGVFKDDPQFEQMLEAIENYRHELDKSIVDTFSQE